jgi:ribosomal protein S18 acetylase RimI-like enzyme
MTSADQRISIEELVVDTTRNTKRDLDSLAELLYAVVHAGASVSFFLPFSIEDARAFWSEKVLPLVRTGARRVLLARDGERIVGTVQLELDTPPNQQHRAAVAKLLVHPNDRRRGIAKALMTELERLALEQRRTLLTLDTVSASHAEFLYSSLGYETVGRIPRYARGALSAELEGTTVMYKELTGDNGVS